jgi:ubiquinone/menaquinone biosynthesis C-methylase UbiE
MQRRALCAVSAFAIATAILVSAQTPGTHPISGRRFAPVMGSSGAEWLDRSEREVEEAPDKALDAIGIRQGSIVADIGAGSGYMTVRMAARVGPSGTVYATDLQAPMLALLQKRLAREHIANVQLVQGAVDDPRLPPSTIEMALLVDVYHEFSAPQAMLRHLRDALTPGGRLVLLEYRKEDASIPIRVEHKMTVAEAKQEIEAEGYTLTRVDEALPRQHILIFAKQ